MPQLPCKCHEFGISCPTLCYPERESFLCPTYPGYIRSLPVSHLVALVIGLLSSLSYQIACRGITLLVFN